MKEKMKTNEERIEMTLDWDHKHNLARNQSLGRYFTSKICKLVKRR